MDVPIPTPCRAISFVSPLIQALIAGRKVQTRRLISPAPDCAACDSSGQPITYASGKPIRCRFGRPGDRLWVQERWTDRPAEPALFDGQTPGIVYAADLTLPLNGRWKPARFMPRRHSRLTLTIQAVRIERLNQISRSDAMAEGFDPSADGPDPIAWFRKIWDELSDDPTNWAADPWVWVIEFERNPPTAAGSL